MKKFFGSILVLALVLTASVGFTCEGPSCPSWPPLAGQSVVSGNYFAGASSFDAAFAGKFTWDYSKNYAVAMGAGFASGETSTSGEGNSIFGAYQRGYATAMDMTIAKAYAFDFGLTSIAGADVKNFGTAYTFGLVDAPNAYQTIYYGGEPGGPGYYLKIHGNTAGEIKYFKNGHPENQSEWTFLGKNKGCDNGPRNDFSSSTVYLGGSVYQLNVAVENKYPTQGFAINSSGGEFLATASDFDKGKNDAFSSAGIMGGIETSGHSIVKVDPFGPAQSAYGLTTNTTKIMTSGELLAGSVYGNGQVGLQSKNGGAMAQSMTAFGYSGTTYGTGIAVGNVSTFSTPSFSTATSSGSSSSFAK